MACKGMKKPRRMSVGGILTSTAAGAASGAAAGGIGAIPGALIGLGTGVLGHINENKEREERERMLAEQRKMRSQANFNASLEAQPANIPLLPMGGLIPYGNETVELESGEPFMSPDGQIDSIPTTAPTHAQGGVPITLPNGTQVLGKLKNTEGKQFKEMGRKLENAQSKYIKALKDNPTSIAAKTSELMLRNIEKEYNDLFVEQEELKEFKMGGKMPYGGLVPYPDGGLIPPGYQPTGDPVKDARALEYFRNKHARDLSTAGDTRLNPSDVTPGSLYEARTVFKPGTNEKAGTLNRYRGVPGEIPNLIGSPAPTRFELDSTAVGNRLPKFEIGGPVEPILPSSNLVEGLSSGFQADIMQGRSEDGSNRGFNLNLPNVNFGNVLGTIGSLAPVAYNIAQGLSGAEEQDPRDFYNPYEAGARSLMRQRRYNIQPELEQNRLAQATYQRGLREAALSQAQYLGGLQAGAIGRSRADAAAIARQQNINNQFLAEQAQMDAQFGAQRAATNLQVDTANAQARAAARGFIGTGLGQLGQFTQNRQLMNNQILRDAQRLGLLEDLMANYEFIDGKWQFKATGQEQSPEDVMDYIKGR